MTEARWRPHPLSGLDADGQPVAFRRQRAGRVRAEHAGWVVGQVEIDLDRVVRLYRAIDGAGGRAVLDLYDGMPHVFQMRPELADAPETRAALKKMATFLKRNLGD